MKFEEIKVTRRSIARGEIETAIDLLVLGGDAVSCHVLASAASDVLRGVAQSTGKKTFDSIAEEYVKPEHLKDWRRHMSGNYNFFKHVKDDPCRELDSFRPETTVIKLFSAVVDYGVVYGQHTAPMLLFKAWFYCRHPSWLLPPLNATIEALKPRLGSPAGLPLAEAVVAVRHLLTGIKRDPSIIVEALQAAHPNHKDYLEV